MFDKNEIKKSPKITVRAKGTSWSWNMKHNSMTVYCYNFTFLDGVSFWEAWRIPNHPQSLCSTFWTCCKNLFFVKFTLMKFLKLFHINFDTYFFGIFPKFITELWVVWAVGHMDLHITDWVTKPSQVPREF